MLESIIEVAKEIAKEVAKHSGCLVVDKAVNVTGRSNEQLTALLLPPIERLGIQIDSIIESPARTGYTLFQQGLLYMQAELKPPAEVKRKATASKFVVAAGVENLPNQHKLEIQMSNLKNAQHLFKLARDKSSEALSNGELDCLLALDAFEVFAATCFLLSANESTAMSLIVTQLTLLQTRRGIINAFDDSLIMRSCSLTSPSLRIAWRLHNIHVVLQTKCEFNSLAYPVKHFVMGKEVQAIHPLNAAWGTFFLFRSSRQIYLLVLRGNVIAHGAMSAVCGLYGAVFGAIATITCPISCPIVQLMVQDKHEREIIQRCLAGGIVTITRGALAMSSALGNEHRLGDLYLDDGNKFVWRN